MLSSVFAALNATEGSILEVLFAGLISGWVLVVAIGPQNAFVIRQGLRRQHITVVVAICALSDTVLIALGVAGVGQIVGNNPLILQILLWGGAAYLLYFAGQSFLSAWNGSSLPHTDEAIPRDTLRATVITCLALTYFNPHVYLDTVLLLGNLAHQSSRPWWFWAAAATGNTLWFISIGYGSHRLAPLLSTPKTWRIIDTVIGLVVTGIAVVMISKAW